MTMILGTVKPAMVSPVEAHQGCFIWANPSCASELTNPSTRWTIANCPGMPGVLGAVPGLPE